MDWNLGNRRLYLLSVLGLARLLLSMSRGVTQSTVEPI